jgi:ankyrin repeat protein
MKTHNKMIPNDINTGDCKNNIKNIKYDVDIDGNTELHTAIALNTYKSKLYAMELMVQYPQLAQHKNNMDEYPLHIACRFGNNLLVLRLLHIFPFAATRYDVDGNYPLHLSFYTLCMDARIKLCIMTCHPAATKECNEFGEKPWDLATRRHFISGRMERNTFVIKTLKTLSQCSR